MKKLFVVSDVHSFYDELIEALNEKGFDNKNKNHWFVSCGDLLDRGPKSLECLKFVNSLDRKILIKGNHEDLLQECIRKGYFEGHDYSNGTNKSVYQVTGICPSDNCPDTYAVNGCALEDMKHNELWNIYYDSCIDYYETNKYIFVHGWIPYTFSEEDLNKYGILCNHFSKPIYDINWRDSLDWSNARWLNGMAQWDDGVREPGKTIVCGHWHSAWGHANLHKEDVIDNNVEEDYLKTHYYQFEDDGIIALDACTVISKKVNCVVLEVEDEEIS